MSQKSLSELANLKSFHLAGIVPVAGQPLDFGFPWHDCLVPISSNFLAIERAVLECATAGCETIWIVCPSDMQPLLKHRLGEMVQDPVWISRKMDVFPSESRREIPIYYVEVHPRDQNKRDCLAWSILYGAKVATKVCNGLSQWVAPNKYYVAFPYAVYPSQHLRKYRSEISNHGTFFVLTDRGNSVLDGEYAGFAFDSSQVGRLIKCFWDKQTGKYDPSQPTSERRDGKYITKLLPKEKRYSGRYFKLEEVFAQLDTSDKSYKVEMEWYYDIGSWENLCTYLSSEESQKMQKPKLSYLKYRTWNKVGEDEPETI
jgi:hypothetical protein